MITCTKFGNIQTAIPQEESEGTDAKEKSKPETQNMNQWTKVRYELLS